MKSHLTLACMLLIAGVAHAAPITVGGFTFDAGEAAFADDAFLVSGFVRSNCVATGGTAAGSVQEALSGSDIVQCVNSTTTEGGFVEVLFTDNFIVNGPGTDLVIFELSGPQAPGTPDSRERFGLSIFDGAAFSPFTQFDPVATGFNSGPDPTLDIFAVEVDLTGFGIPPGGVVDRLRLHIFNVNLGTKSADIAALGALNSAPIPEPGSAILFGVGILIVGGALRGNILKLGN